MARDILAQKVQHPTVGVVLKRLRRVAANNHSMLGAQKILRNFRAPNTRSYYGSISHHHHPKHGLEGVRSRNPTNLSVRWSQKQSLYS